MTETTSGVLQTLILKARDGDKTARQQLLERYWALITKAVRARKARLGKFRDDTEDIQQAAAMRVLDELPKHAWQGKNAFGRGWASSVCPRP